MNGSNSIALVVAATLLASSLFAEERESVEAKTSRMVYKQDPRQTMTIYYPDQWKPSDKRPALVIFRCRIPMLESNKVGRNKSRTVSCRRFGSHSNMATALTEAPAWDE